MPTTPEVVDVDSIANETLATGARRVLVDQRLGTEEAKARQDFDAPAVPPPKAYDWKSASRRMIEKHNGVF